ncbi:MAG: ribbon-helix-helix domain-containing protein [Nanoarchaeota archaeon]
MAMELVQIRLPKEQIAIIDDMSKSEGYASRSEVVRDAIRQLLVEKRKASIRKMIGIIPDNGIDSVEEVRKLRKGMTDKDYDIDELNKLLRPLDKVQ